MNYLSKKGFTLIELLVVVAIIGLLSTFAFVSLRRVMEKTYAAAAKAQLKNIASALDVYFAYNNEVYPCDVSRDLPPGIEQYLSPNWPKAPWPGSVFDWEYWDANTNGCAGGLADDPKNETVYQISIRFCTGGNCRFPNEAWADGFDNYSSVYWCVQGPCRAHGGMDYDHPACCVGGACPSDQIKCPF